IDKKEERLFYIKKRRGCALVLTQPLPFIIIIRNTIVAHLLRVLQSTVKSKKRQASTFAANN
ncbi:hypothetical protein, partial [Bacteroides faecis]